MKTYALLAAVVLSLAAGPARTAVSGRQSVRPQGSSGTAIQLVSTDVHSSCMTGCWAQRRSDGDDRSILADAGRTLDVERAVARG